jgi:hypothetical protein
VLVTEVPTPLAVTGRPREARGYPVPAITPWENGVPVLATTGTARTYLCAVERRCSICGTTMPPGPVWRVAGGDEADAIDDTLTAGRPYRNAMATGEAPGHRACMLYAAVVCPYLSRPTARRGQAVVASGLAAERGDRRGTGGAVVGFSDYEFRYQDVVLFRFAGLVEFRRHELGEEQLEALAEAVAAEKATATGVTVAAAKAAGAAHTAADMAAAIPAYLTDDEAAAERRFRAYLNGTIAASR